MKPALVLSLALIFNPVANAASQGRSYDICAAWVSGIADPACGQPKKPPATAQDFAAILSKGDVVCLGNGKQKPGTVRASVIAELVGDKKWHDAMHAHGVRLCNASVEGSLDLSDQVLKIPLVLEFTTFNTPPNFDSMRTSRYVSLAGSTVSCPKSAKEKVLFTDAQIDGKLDLRGVQSVAEIDMGHIRVSGPLFMNSMPMPKNVPERRAIFNRVVISSSHIGEKISLEGASIGDPKDCPALTDRESEQRPSVDLAGSDVGADVNMKDKFKAGFVKLQGATIRGDLDIEDSAIDSLNLAEATVKGTFTVGGGKDWKPGNSLSMHDAVLGEVHGVDPAKWPATTSIAGATFGRIGRLFAQSDASEAQNFVDKLISWLDKQDDTQAYVTFAMGLDREGRYDEANAVRFAGKQKERCTAHGWRWWWLSFILVTVGYGYYKAIALLWCALLVAVGAMLFRTTPESRHKGMPYGIFYSVDMLLPIIRLREMHYKIDIKGYARYYFYFHKIVGWVLGSILVAALGGFLK